MFRFDDPLAFLLLILLPGAFWLQRRWEAGRRGALRFSAVETIRGTGIGSSRWARERIVQPVAAPLPYPTTLCVSAFTCFDPA